MNTIRVALINHFSNPAVRHQLDLQPDGRGGIRYKDFAWWNTNIINGLKGRDDVELHVIAPHVGMCHPTQEFELEGVHYLFFRKEPPYPWNRLEAYLWSQEKHDYPRNRRRVKHFLSKIRPDIVVLIGAENAYFSITAMDVKGIPLMIHLQTVYANPDRIKNTGRVDRKRWDVELDLFRKTPYMACSGRMYYDLVKGYNPGAIVFPRKWPASKFPEVPDVEKKYDYVYFARYLNKNKGFDNAVEAMGLFVKAHPEARLLAVGSRDAEWPVYENRIHELGLDKNLEIHGSFPDYLDLLRYVKQARCALLPITMDVLSGTILESMRMGMPVVTCRTSGTPSLNEKRETVLITEIGDCKGLSENMLRLYENPRLQDTLRENAFQYLAEKDRKNVDNVDVMVEQFKAVIAHYHDGTPIPQEMLYNTDENKDYRQK